MNTYDNTNTSVDYNTNNVWLFGKCCFILSDANHRESSHIANNNLLNFLQKNPLIATSLWVIAMHRGFHSIIFHRILLYFINKTKRVIINALHITLNIVFISSSLTLASN